LTLLLYRPWLRFYSFLWYYVVFLSGSRYCFIPVLPLYIQLTRGECYDPISGFKPVILLFLSQVRNYLHLKVVGNGHFVLFVQCSTESVVICFSFQIYLRNLVSLIVVLRREIITYSTNCWQTQSLNITVSNQCLHRKLHNNYLKNRSRM
jgi:hypothetical protein